jgi:GDP-4-dehydro-6-deoxy-D-mannose reductase
MPTVLITGAAGFSGQHLVKYLRKVTPKLRVVGLDQEGNCREEIDAFYEMDLNRAETLPDLVRKEKPQWVIHLAAVMPPAEEGKMWKVNVGGTVNLIRGLASLSGSRVRVVCIGSAAEYNASPEGLMSENSPDGGESVYGKAKWAQTSLARLLGRQLAIPVIIARPFNLVGPGLPQNWVAAEMCRQVFENKGEIHLGNLDSERDFIDVRDAVEAYWLLATTGKAGEIYNVSSGKPIRIRDLLSILTEIQTATCTVKMDPERIRTGDLLKVFGDNRKLKTATGWEPRISLRKSLQDMLAELGP